MTHSPVRTRGFVGCLALGILTLSAALRPAAAEQPPVGAAKKNDQAEKLRAVIDEVLGRHQVFPDPEGKEPLQVIPALRWSNNTRGTENALTVLYVRKGRPYAVACLFPYDRGMIHDFQSLARAEDKIVARRNGQTVWQPQEAGVEYAPIPNAPPPKQAGPNRLR